MYRKRISIVLTALIVLSIFTLTSCSAIKALSGKNVDETVYYGTAEADKVDISAEVAGKIKELKVLEGQNVKPNTLVAVIDSPENVIKAQQSEISVKNAENELAKINEGSRAEEIKAQAALVRQAEAAVKQAQSVLNQANDNFNSAQTTYNFKKKNYDDTLALFKSDAVSQQELDNAQYAMDTAQYALGVARQSQETATHQVESAKAQQAAVQDKLSLLKNGATDKTKTTAEYGIEQAKKGFDLSKLMLDKSNVFTLAGGVVESVNYSVGEYVTPGSALITIVDPDDMWVKVFIPEKILPMVKIGNEVSITCDNLQGERIKGKVTYIATEAEFTPMNIVTKKDRTKLVFAVKVKLLDHLDQVKPGMLLDVDLDPGKSAK